MPFKSKAQMRWMFAKKPEMAKRWADETPNISKLPNYRKPDNSHPYSLDPWNAGKCLICGQRQGVHKIG